MDAVAAGNQTKRWLSSLAIGGLLYLTLYIGAGAFFDRVWHLPGRVEIAIYMIICLGVGLFIGRRLPRFGWLYAGLPMTLWIIFCHWQGPHIGYMMTLEMYWWVLSVLPASLGGWIGSRHADRRDQHP